MRTTLDLDEDVLAAARSLARLERRSLGRVVSSLARKGLAPRDDRLGEEEGFPIFAVGAGAPPITDEMVQTALDER
jgi:hypothetical protein